MFVSDITSQNINALQCTRQYFGDPVSNAEHPTPLGLHREGEYMCESCTFPLLTKPMLLLNKLLFKQSHVLVNVKTF